MATASRSYLHHRSCGFNTRSYTGVSCPRRKLCLKRAGGEPNPDVANAKDKVNQAQFYAISKLSNQVDNLQDAHLDLNAQAQALLRQLGLEDAARQLSDSNAAAEQAVRAAQASPGAGLRLVAEDAGLVPQRSLLELEQEARAAAAAAAAQQAQAQAQQQQGQDKNSSH